MALQGDPTVAYIWLSFAAMGGIFFGVGAYLLYKGIYERNWNQNIIDNGKAMWLKPDGYEEDYSMLINNQPSVRLHFMCKDSYGTEKHMLSSAMSLITGLDILNSGDEILVFIYKADPRYYYCALDKRRRSAAGFVLE